MSNFAPGDRFIVDSNKGMRTNGYTGIIESVSPNGLTTARLDEPLPCGEVVIEIHETHLRLTKRGPQ